MSADFKLTEAEWHRKQAVEQKYHRLAQQAGEKISEGEDRRQFQKDLAAGPWFDQSNLREN